MLELSRPFFSFDKSFEDAKNQMGGKLGISWAFLTLLLRSSLTFPGISQNWVYEPIF
jgi:hypothetical protein